MDGSVPILALKVVGTPVVIGGATMAGRRWGPAVSGWIGGLPLASGPLTYYLTVEQGAAFGAASAGATLAGLVAVAAFAMAFGWLATAGPWSVPLAAGLAAYVVVAVALLFVPMAPVVALGAAAAALTVAIRVLVGRVRGLLPAGPDGAAGAVGAAGAGGADGAPGAGGPDGAAVRWAPSTRWEQLWDVLARAAVATVLVVGLSAAAAALGARLVGLVAPFPVYASVMASFAFAYDGPAASLRLLRGVLVGAYGFACFYLVVALLARQTVPGAFVLATAAALTVQACTMWTIRRLGW